LDGELPAAVAAELGRLRAENARLLRLLRLTPAEAAPPGPAQAGYFEAPPGPVHAGSAPEAKVAFFGALFAARTDVYAVRYENRRAGRAGWVPAVWGGWRKGVPHAERDYLPLTAEVLAAHLSGKMHVGLYPLLDGDRCWWVAADFDGPEAMFDALMYLKAARALQVPAALEVSRSGTGAHTWVFFTAPVPAEAARRLGAGLLREAMALRGRMKLASYDRLFPSQDLLPAGGVGNLIAMPLFKPTRRDGTTVFLDPGTAAGLEHGWQCAGDLGESAEPAGPRRPDAGCAQGGGNAWRRAACRGYAAAVAKGKRRGCRPVLLAQLRALDEEVRVRALHRVCPCGAGFLVYERFRGEVRRLQKTPEPAGAGRGAACPAGRLPDRGAGSQARPGRGAGLAVQRRGLGAGASPASGDPVLAAAVTAADAAICGGGR